jgi:MFS family permease
LSKLWQYACPGDALHASSEQGDRRGRSVAPLFVGRGLQGLAAAVLAPSALALLMTVFPAGRLAGRDRNRALPELRGP